MHSRLKSQDSTMFLAMLRRKARRAHISGNAGIRISSHRQIDEPFAIAGRTKPNVKANTYVTHSNPLTDSKNPQRRMVQYECHHHSRFPAFDTQTLLPLASTIQSWRIGNPRPMTLRLAFG